MPSSKEDIDIDSLGFSFSIARCVRKRDPTGLFTVLEPQIGFMQLKMCIDGF